MGGKRKKRNSDEYNVRLDIFLQKLKIEQDKKEQIINFVEDLTYDVIKSKSKVKPELRLRK
jgi:hypothetical protein